MIPRQRAVVVPSPCSHRPCSRPCSRPPNGGDTTAVFVSPASCFVSMCVCLSFSPSPSCPGIRQLLPFLGQTRMSVSDGVALLLQAEQTCEEEAFLSPKAILPQSMHSCHSRRLRLNLETAIVLPASSRQCQSIESTP